MKSIAIIGYGYVGRAMHNFFANHYEIVIYDPWSHQDKDDANHCDAAVICVPTPRSEDGSCDLSAVYDTFDWLRVDLIILKSTITIGTTDKLVDEYPELNIVFSPEFAGESTYWSEYKFHNDVVETPWFIFGGDKINTSKAVDIYSKIGGPTKKYIQCEAKEAEAAKYMENVFYATKVLFCYEFSEILTAIGVDYNTVRELWQLDPRLNPMHTSVFEENNSPFSGKCLPKDLSALIMSSIDNGYSPEFLKEVDRSNNRIGEMRFNRREK